MFPVSINAGQVESSSMLYYLNQNDTQLRLLEQACGTIFYCFLPQTMGAGRALNFASLDQLKVYSISQNDNITTKSCWPNNYGQIKTGKAKIRKGLINLNDITRAL